MLNHLQKYDEDCVFSLFYIFFLVFAKFYSNCKRIKKPHNLFLLKIALNICNFANLHSLCKTIGTLHFHKIIFKLGRYLLLNKKITDSFNENCHKHFTRIFVTSLNKKYLQNILNYLNHVTSRKCL